MDSSVRVAAIVLVSLIIVLLLLLASTVKVEDTIIYKPTGEQVHLIERIYGVTPITWQVRMADDSIKVVTVDELETK